VHGDGAPVVGGAVDDGGEDIVEDGDEEEEEEEEELTSVRESDSDSDVAIQRIRRW